MKIKEDSEKQENSQQRLKQFKVTEADETDEAKLEKMVSFFRTIVEKKKSLNLTDKPQKTTLEKLKSFFSFCTKKKNNDDSGWTKFKNGIKRSKHGKPVKSLRLYIEQKCKWIIFLFVTYIIFFGLVVSTPMLINHFRTISRNETEQERSVT